MSTVGSTLTCLEGTWGGHPAPTLSVQWLRDGSAIPGATTATYVVQSADAGHTLSCLVTASNGVGKTASALSGGIAIPPPAAAGGGGPAGGSGGPSGGVLGTTIVEPLATGGGRVSTTGAKGKVQVRCSLAMCKGTVQVRLRVVSHHHARTLVLATGSFTIAAGQSAGVTLHLTSVGRSRLAHDRHHPVTAKLRLALLGGAVTTRSVIVS